MPKFSGPFVPAPDYLSDLFAADQGNKFYRSVAYDFIYQFLASEQANSRTAFNVCQEFENGFISLENFQFPLSRTLYEQRKQERDELRKPLSARKKELEDLIAESLGEASTFEDLLPERAKVAQDSATKAAAEKIDIEKQLKKIPNPNYRKDYDPTDKRFHDSNKPRPFVAKPEDWRYLTEWFHDTSLVLKHEEQPALFTNLSVLYDMVRRPADGDSLEDAGQRQTELRMLQLLLAYEKVPQLKTFIDKFAYKDQRGYHYIAAKMLGIKPEEVAGLLNDQSPLQQYGVITGGSMPGLPKVSEYLAKMLSQPDLTEENLKGKLAGKPLATKLDWNDDFQGLGSYGERMAQLIEHSRDQKRAGIAHHGPVIFLYGPPDTGKTSAAAALGKHLGMDVRLIGEEIQKTRDDSKGTKVQELTPLEQLSQILMSLAVSGSPDRLFIIDEGDRILPQGETDLFGRPLSTDKDPIARVVIQRFFEENTAAGIIITTNHYEKIHPAVRRRSALAIAMDTPNLAQRMEIIRRVVESHNEENPQAQVSLTPEQINLLAKTYVAPAGKWASAIPNAAITAGNRPDAFYKELVFFLEAQAERDHGSVASIKATHAPIDYDFRLANISTRGDVSLQELTDSISARVEETGKFRILLDGWPGTGKSEYGWFLGDHLKKDVMYVRASDILGPYNGQSEQNIGKVFRDAARSGRMLMIDEIDSVLRPRDGVAQSWERAIVDEFLTQLEHYEGMIIVTTNNMDAIDDAALRRFKRRVSFDFMNDEQKLYAFKKFFGVEPEGEALKTLQSLHKLSPSDFALVKEDAVDFDYITDATRLVGALEKQNSAKPREHKPKWKVEDDFGFGPKRPSPTRDTNISIQPVASLSANTASLNATENREDTPNTTFVNRLNGTGRGQSL